MAASAFGVLLRYLREERRFSLRELAQLADIDHAYIYRLETGEKESPSDDVVSRLIKILKPGRREAEMLRFLAGNAAVDPRLTEYVAQDPTVTFDEFQVAAAGVSYRGSARPEPKTLIERARQFLREE